MDSPKKITRWQILRANGFGWLTTTTICFVNWLAEAPEGHIFFMHVHIEYDPYEQIEG